MGTFILVWSIIALVISLIWYYVFNSEDEDKKKSFGNILLTVVIVIVILIVCAMVFDCGGIDYDGDDPSNWARHT